MKFYRMNNFFSDFNENSYWDSSLVVEYKNDYYNLGDIEFEELYSLAKEKSAELNQAISVNSYVELLISNGELFKSDTLTEKQIEQSLQSPIYPQEVWAAGVTYLSLIHI